MGIMTWTRTTKIIAIDMIIKSTRLIHLSIRPAMGFIREWLFHQQCNLFLGVVSSTFRLNMSLPFHITCGINIVLLVRVSRSGDDLIQREEFQQRRLQSPSSSSQPSSSSSQPSPPSSSSASPLISPLFSPPLPSPSPHSISTTINI